MNLNGAPGVIGRTDRLGPGPAAVLHSVHSSTAGWHVGRQDFGRRAAFASRSRGDADQVRLVTLDGEIVEADGSVVVGPKSVTSGLVSRRSELRALKREIGRLDEEIRSAANRLSSWCNRRRTRKLRVQSQINENRNWHPACLIKPCRPKLRT